MKSQKTSISPILALLLLGLLSSSCQFGKALRGPSSVVDPENEVDPKFEEFEGGSFSAEQKINDELVKTAKELMSKMYKQAANGVMTRDAHAKSHGCLKASFQVAASSLEQVNRVGLFAKDQDYEAWVRFSNNDHLPIRHDNELDLRGMSVKVMGVPGQKIMKGHEQAMTQDFLMYGSNVFFIKDNKDYVGFIRGLRDDNAARILITEQPRAALATTKAQFFMKNYTNPANMPFHSAVPVRLGLPEDPSRTAMKYRAIPCEKNAHPSPVTKKSPNYMRENLRATLESKEACFLFQVQLQVDPDAMPVEDSTVVWPEREREYGNLPYAPYQTVAKILIPPQTFDTPARDRYCENLAFTPWHSLVEHKPLGRTMRMRRDLYKATSQFRRHTNGASPIEPTRFEID
jgi:hypothetical protein